jgi:NAD(P)-dependent dehydrogenase (short-subunit alcohol dehydrogenase family)
MYQAAKFGLGGFSEALAKEVAPLGIHVTSVEPGGFRTDWGGASMTFAPDIEGYEASVGAVRAFLRTGKYVPMGDPDKAAKAMIRLVNDPQPPVHLILGSEAISLVQAADAARKAELEKWLAVSTSTDHDDATNFLETEAGRGFLTRTGN